ncbi:hypothetical protein Rsub_04068 [Raphidocelis subcapitata]|uniref:Uncharacterized protein n=1 Tax=Raphidocelis subcapitata TaxID=307507 RepID=A0A2V0NVU6_9CHLO|nr:hypothetical protein Rsub_04068 [Raphidocelis subcapitata]|eukprot:GBF91764.1 hypothetical protein Rsub_04068 [Raphidocelis subcapitata]
MGRLYPFLVFVVLWAALADGRVDPMAMTHAMNNAQAMAQLAASGDMEPASATRLAHMGAVIASQGDSLSTYRLGAGLARRLLGERARTPHNPDLLAQLATDAGHAAVMSAMDDDSAMRAARRGHLATQHATIADSYDAWKLAAGVPGEARRRLGEAA